MDVEKVCRTCLSKDQKLSLIYENIDGKENIANILNECTAYKVYRSDELPQLICISCQKAAYNAIKFKRQCEESYRHLVSILKIKVGIQSENSTEKSTQTEDSTFNPECCDGNFCTSDGHRECEHRGRASACRFCDKRISSLEPHSEIGSKSHNQCKICDRQFTRRAHLRRHLAIIHKILDDTKQDCSIEEENKIHNKLGATHIAHKENSEYVCTSDRNESSDSDEEYERPLASLQKSEKSHDSCCQILDNECNTEPSVTKLVYEESRNEKTTKNPLSEEYIDCLNDSKPTDQDVLPVLHPCTNCKKYFKSAILLRKHINTRHKASKVFKCEQCEQTFSHSSHYQRHKDIKHSERMHKCGVCDKSFTTKIYLQRHLNIHERKRYACKECKQSYLTKEELNAHVKAEGHDKPLLCPECGLRCKTSNILMVHMRRHNGEKPFKCKFCSKGFPRMDDLRVHEKYHTGEKSHFCETCGKGFQRKYNLTIHLRIHTGEKPYSCPHCPQAFAQGNDLKAHIRRHTGERFRCEVCGAAFLQGYQIRQHKLTEHGIKEEPPTQRVAKFTSAEAQEQQIKQNLQRELTQAFDVTNLEENIGNEDILNLEMDLKSEEY